MFCRHCGKQIPDGAYICTGCGMPTDAYASPSQTPVQKQRNILAIVGFVLSFFVSLAGLICSAIALKRADSDFNGDGKSLALAGTILSSVVLVLEIIAGIFVAIFWGRILHDLFFGIAYA